MRPFIAANCMTCRSCWLIAISFAICMVGRANPPELTHSSPLAVMPGMTTELIFHGKDLEGATGIWTGFNARTNILSRKDADHKSIRASLDVAKNVPRGIYAARVATGAGVSQPLMIMVDDLSTVKEIASNHSRDGAQAVLPPVAVDGAGNGTESDFYCFDASQGQWLTLEVVSSRLGYAFDALVRVFDEKGNEIAVVDDTPGLHGDCRLCFQSKQHQRYYVEVVDSKYSSSARHKYRLRIVNELASTHASATTDPFHATSAELNLINSDSNMSKETALEVVAPANLQGVFRNAGEVFFYRLKMTTGSRRRICGITRSEDLPTDLLFSVYAPDGTLVASHDDAGLDDACFHFQADQDGDYLLSVREVNGCFGSDYAFRFSVTEARTGFELSASANRLIIGQGGQGLLPVVCNRIDYNGPITMRIDNPSAPYQLVNGVIPKGQNKTLLKIIPSAELTPGDLRTIQITGYGEDAATVSSSHLQVVDEVRSLSPSLPYPPIELWDQLAVSIANPLPDFFGLRLGADEVVFPRIVGELYFTVHCVDRLAGFTEAIVVEAENLPPGFKASGHEKPVGNSKNNEYRFQINGPAQAPLGKHSISVRALGSFQGQRKEVVINDIPLRVIEPLIVSLELSDIDVEKGEVSMIVKATRFLPRAGGDRKEIYLKLKEHPDWITGPESSSIDVGKNDTVVRMAVTASQDPSERKGKIVFTAETSVNGQTVQVDSEPFEICFPPANDSSKGRLK